MAMKDRFKRAPGTKGRTKAKRPDAARGKKTTKGRVRAMFENLKQTAKSKTGMNMSPIAMGGRTKTKTPSPLRRMSESMRRQKLKGATRSTIKGAGATGSAMTGQAMKLAKQLKTTGRLSVQDLMRAKKMMMGRKGK